MKKVVYGEDERVLQWMEARIDERYSRTDSVAFAMEEDGEIIGAVAYNMYTIASVSMHVVALPGKYWLTKDFLWRCFAYPFVQLGCKRVTALVREDNLYAQKFDENLGFKREGLIRQGCTDGSNLILYGMLKDECRFLGIKL